MHKQIQDTKSNPSLKEIMCDLKNKDLLFITVNVRIRARALISRRGSEGGPNTGTGPNSGTGSNSDNYGTLLFVLLRRLQLC